MDNGNPTPEYYPDSGLRFEENDAQTDTTPPPTYTECQNEAPPPTYESLFGELREAQRNASGRGQFIASVWEIFIHKVGFTLFIALSLVLPAAMITIGIKNLYNCPAEHYIPIWLVVGGGAFVIVQIISVVKRIKKKYSTQAEGTQDDETNECDSLSSMVWVFNLAWFIAGSVWVYRIHQPNTSYPIQFGYCDHVTYYMAFWLITLLYSCTALVCCCTCCVIIVS